MEQMESLQRANQQHRLAEWSRRVEACRNSGLSVGQWCQENGIAVSTYFSWQKKVFQALKEVQEVTFAEVPIMEHSQLSGHIVAAMEVSGVQIQVYEGADEAGNSPGSKVMLNDFNCSCPVYIACGYTDLRRGIDGLANLVKTQFQMDPFQRALFLFCGRRRDRIKALYWEGDGFLLLYKRLESGSFQWPRSTEGVQALTPQQYRWLMEGLKTEQPKANKAVSGLSVI